MSSWLSRSKKPDDRDSEVVVADLNYKTEKVRFYSGLICIFAFLANVYLYYRDGKWVMGTLSLIMPGWILYEIVKSYRIMKRRKEKLTILEVMKS